MKPSRTHQAAPIGTSCAAVSADTVCNCGLRVVRLEASELQKNAVADSVWVVPTPKASNSAMGMSQVPAWIAYDRKVCCRACPARGDGRLKGAAGCSVQCFERRQWS